MNLASVLELPSFGITTSLEFPFVYEEQLPVHSKSVTQPSKNAKSKENIKWGGESVYRLIQT